MCGFSWQGFSSDELGGGGMPTKLALVRSLVDIPLFFSPREAIERLTFWTQDGASNGVFLPREAEVLKRTLKDRAFTSEHLEVIVEELRRLDAVEPDDLEGRDQDSIHTWRVCYFHTYIQEARQSPLSSVLISQMFQTMHHHQVNVERQTGKRCRKSFLRAVVVAFLTTPLHDSPARASVRRSARHST
ncbi:hypothetical protein HQ487_02710 [Candidatus Uhrbacteria bacterium]|nr:hypothetical protein [Candidatus Uhrbacteria bacterium]